MNELTASVMPSDPRVTTPDLSMIAAPLVAVTSIQKLQSRSGDALPLSAIRLRML
jgi:hypothetical protein